MRVSEAGNLFQREELEDKRLNVVLKGLQQSLGRLEKRVESLMRVIEMEKASTSEGGRACDVVELVERGGAKMYWLKWTEGLDSKKKSCEKAKKDEQEADAITSSTRLAELAAEESFVSGVLQADRAKKEKFMTQREEMRKLGQEEELRKRKGDEKRVDRVRTATKMEEDFEANEATYTEELRVQKERTGELREKMEEVSKLLGEASRRSDEKVGLVEGGEELVEKENEVKKLISKQKKEVKRVAEEQQRLKRTCRAKKKVAEKSRKERGKIEKENKDNRREDSSDERLVNTSRSLDATNSAFRATVSSLQVEASEQVEVTTLSEEADKAIQDATECAKSTADHSHEKNTIDIETRSHRNAVDCEFGKTILECSGSGGSDELVRVEGVRDALECETAEESKLAKNLNGLRKKETKVKGRADFQSVASGLWTRAKIAVAQTNKSEQEARSLPSSRPHTLQSGRSANTAPKRIRVKGKSSKGKRGQ